MTREQHYFTVINVHQTIQFTQANNKRS